MAIDVRRSVSYCYAIRFHLKGINKQVMLDNLLKSIESSLSALQRKLDTPWKKHLERDHMNRLFLGNDFFKF